MSERVVDGMQFFDEELKYLKRYEHEYVYGSEKKLTASSLVTYILLRSLCDEVGLILEQDLNLKEECEKHNLPYSSIHNGYHRLFDIGLLDIDRINGRTYIQLPIVAAYVPTSINPKIPGYFLVPKAIFRNGFLKGFIKARDVRGLLGLLDLINGLYRESKRKSKQLLKRKKITLFNKLKQSKKVFNKWLKRVFYGKNSLIQVKQEIEGLFELAFVENVFRERKQDAKFDQFQASAHNTLSSLLRSSSVRYTSDELQDMQYACKQEIITPMYYAVEANENAMSTVKAVMADILSASVRELERQIDNIQVLGAYFRKTLRLQTKRIFQEEQPLRYLIASSYKDANWDVPEQFQ
ncbi:hypothetical protein [Lysinibacillus fusiformis]|uniref:hypothetical protein n=1 Tax=Lysinibacillus fusiformis TaxID=28031 RepID=UPI0023A9498B|nr:hypothetical protein [Lysinibacillus fusiformis]WEA41187.1 hypothetical protein PWJ66_09690 [Lysinibacillus fusiformis]